MAFEHAIALTGGIASGKSSASSLLMLEGLRIIDADTISHRILDEQRQWVSEHFGKGYITETGVNRPELGKKIFADPEARKQLEGLLHPLIREAIEAESLKHEQLGFAYLIDIPLFFETNAYPIEKSVVIYAPKAVQCERLMKRNGFSEAEALQRIESQMDIEVKKSKATWVIDNSGKLKQLQAECARFVEAVKEEFGA
jgi:dephospho-CoA kinase